MSSIEQKKILLVGSNKKIRDSYLDKFISHFQNTGKGDIDLTWATHDCRGWKDENFHRLFHYETSNPNPFKEWVKKEIFSKVISHGGKRRCPLILQDAQPELCLSTLEAIVDVCREAVDSTAMPFFIVSIDTVSAEWCTPYLIGNFESIWIIDLNKAYIPDELCYIPKIPVNGGNRCAPKKLDWIFAEKHINWPWRQTSKATETQKTTEAGGRVSLPTNRKELFLAYNWIITYTNPREGKLCPGNIKIPDCIADRVNELKENDYGKPQFYLSLASLGLLLSSLVKSGIPVYRTKDGKTITSVADIQRLWNEAGLQNSKGLDWTEVYTVKSHLSDQYLKIMDELETPIAETSGAGGEVKKQNPKLVLRTSENKVCWEGKEQKGLSPKPYQLLYVLALTPGELIPYGRMKWLISADTENLPKALSKHISSIKARIPALKNIIHNTEDLGYELRLKKEDVLVQGKIAEVDTLLQLD